MGRPARAWPRARAPTLPAAAFSFSPQLQQELDPTYDAEDEEEGAPPKRYYTYRVRVSNLS